MTYDLRVGERLVLIEKHLHRRNELLNEMNMILADIRDNMKEMK